MQKNNDLRLLSWFNALGNNSRVTHSSEAICALSCYFRYSNFRIFKMKELKKTVILSPHADDAAFSLGCLLAKRTSQEPVHVATVFSKSNFAPLASAKNNEIDVTDIRSEEDRMFCRSVSCHLKEFGYEDAALRHKIKNISEVFTFTLKEEADFVDRVFDGVFGFCNLLKPNLILAPVGAGEHIDHKIVNEVALRLSDRGGWQIAYYLDQPYAKGKFLDQSYVRAGYNNIMLLDVLKSTVLKKLKMRQVGYYSSQPASKKMINLLEKSKSFYEVVINKNKVVGYVENGK